MAVDLRAEIAAHPALDGLNRAPGVGGGLPLGGFAHDALAGFGNRHDGRRGARAVGVGDDDGFAVFDVRHAGVCGSKVNADHISHREFLCFPVLRIV